MEVKLDLTGDKELLANLVKLAKDYPRAAAAALYQEGFAICALAQDKCPVDEARLEKSAYVAPPTGDPSSPLGSVVEIGFGTVYAVPQHEHTEFRHPKKGEAKYLQKAVDQRANGMTSRLAARIEQNAERGVGVDAIPAEKPTKPSE